MNGNPFDPSHDGELGAWLREVLDEGGTASLMRGVRAALAREQREQPMDVLARWFRPALAVAAAAAVAGVAVWLSGADDRALASGPTAEQVLMAETVPAHEIVLASFMEDR